MMGTRNERGQLRNSVSINTARAITGKIDRFREIPARECYMISPFFYPDKPSQNLIFMDEL